MTNQTKINIIVVVFSISAYALALINYYDNRQQDKIVFGTVDNLTKVVEVQKIQTENISDLVDLFKGFLEINNNKVETNKIN